MTHPFEEGETYFKADCKEDMFVFAIDSETELQVVLVVCMVDPVTKLNIGSISEITILQLDYSDWKKRE